MTWDLRSRSQQAGAVILMVAPTEGQRGPELPTFHAMSSLMTEEREYQW